MSRSSNQATGIAIFIPAVLGIMLYTYFVWFSQWSAIIIQYTVYFVVVGILGLIAWIGYTMATNKEKRN